MQNDGSIACLIWTCRLFDAAERTISKAVDIYYTAFVTTILVMAFV
jgi:hypothetical protein